MGSESDEDSTRVCVPKVTTLKNNIRSVGVVLFDEDGYIAMYHNMVTEKMALPQGPRKIHESSIEANNRILTEIGYGPANMVDLKMKTKQYAQNGGPNDIHEPFAITHRMGAQDTLETTEWFVYHYDGDGSVQWGAPGAGRDWEISFWWRKEDFDGLSKEEKEVVRLACGFYLDEDSDGDFDESDWPETKDE